MKKGKEYKGGIDPGAPPPRVYKPPVRWHHKVKPYLPYALWGLFGACVLGLVLSWVF